MAQSAIIYEASKTTPQAVVTTAKDIYIESPAANGALTYLNTLLSYWESSSRFTTQCLNTAYPVGTIIITKNNNAPSSIGTWQKWGMNRTILTCDGTTDDPTEATGGEATHTLTTAELPPHRHRMYGNTSRVNYGGSRDADHGVGGDSGNWSAANGGGQPHNNIQPSVAYYMWKRVS